MAPARTNQAVAIDMYRRMADCFNGAIMVQNADGYAPLAGDRIAELIDDVPSIEYVKEERQPGPRHIAETSTAAGDRIKTIFGGAGGKNLPDEMNREADGCMPACAVLRRRGILTTTAERSPAVELDAADKREVSSLLAALEEGDFDGELSLRRRVRM